MSKLSIIIPAYNEAATIATVLNRVLSVPMPMGWEREVLVVDDGSTDDTLHLAQQFAPQVRAIGQQKNSGKGTAVLRGIQEATGNYVLVQDADLEYEPEQIPQLLAPITAGSADMVYGSRTLRHQERYGSRLAALGVWVITKLINVLWGLSLSDSCAGYKLFPRVAEAWRAGGFESDILIASAAARRGWRIAEVGVVYHPRTKAQGKKIRYRDGVRAIVLIIADRLGVY